VWFDGKSAFYRLSIAELFVPYADPRNPLYRKGAFDLGNVGSGALCNNLKREFFSLLSHALY
jgi:primary-amine oxidase